MHCWRMVWRNAAASPFRISLIEVKLSMACSLPMPAREFVGRTPAAGVLNGLNCLANTVDGVADGVGKVAIEEKEFENAVGCEIGGIDLAVGFESRATAQQPDLLKILVAGVLAFRLTRKQRLVDLEERCDGVCAFEVAAKADKVPSLAMDHGCVADAFEEMNGVDEGSQYVVDIGTELGFGVRGVHEVIEAVEALPLLGGDFFADLAGIFARGIDATGDRCRMMLVEDERFSIGPRGRRTIRVRKDCRARR